MAFEGLSEKLQNVFKKLRGKGRLTEADVKEAMKEVRIALLEADVNFKVVKQFVKAVEARAVGEDVMESLTPGQMVIKIVNEEMIHLLGDNIVPLPLKPSSAMTVIMMAGLQGAGKTTTAAKIAGKLKAEGRKPLLVACDVYRPAAIEQLKINGKKQDVPVFSLEGEKSPVKIAESACKYASENGLNCIILDTAGRLHIDESMMDELKDIKDAVSIDCTILTVDAMTGQDAVNVASEFNDVVGTDGVIITKLDGDTKGGAALSIRAVTGKPIFYAGMGEKLSDLEPFYPDRMASRILGMGDVLTLIEKAQAEIDDKAAKELEQKIRKAEFNFNDFLEQFSQIKKMGGISSLLGMIPGVSSKVKGADMVDESQIKKVESIIYSMTNEERERPSIINPSRKNRIAKGAGVNVADVNRLIKQFEQSKKMMKQMSGMMGKKRNPFGFGKLPF